METVKTSTANGCKLTCAIPRVSKALHQLMHFLDYSDDRCWREANSCFPITVCMMA